jgi:hypothetical protein
MLSLTIFAVAAGTATQAAPAVDPPLARRPENVVVPEQGLVEIKLAARRFPKK